MALERDLAQPDRPRIKPLSIQTRRNRGGEDIQENNESAMELPVEDDRQPYDVRGCPNPYLGLHSFTYSEWKRYAGRRGLVLAAAKRLLAAEQQPSLLFITGEHGSGKSSLVQAGLLPVLRGFYLQRNIQVRQTLFRPGREPLVSLAAALQSGLPPIPDLPARLAVEGLFTQLLRRYTPANQVNLLVVDQFEELFTQSLAEQRESFFAILEHLPSFANLRLHVIATLRLDYLPELFDHPALYDAARQGIDLRAMRVAELKEAIQRPLQQMYPNGEKRFDDWLLERLAQDAAEDATHLPLLQVTLADIWERGSLTADAYRSLIGAIDRRAERVYTYADYATNRQVKRSPQEREALMAILLDLVEVSPDDPHRDVCCRRSVTAVARGSTTRTRLIMDLVAAGLLSESSAAQDDSLVHLIEITNAALLAHWERLRQALDDQRTVIQQRRRFSQALQEWRNHQQADNYLLRGVWLAEAQALARRKDVALRGAEAQTLVKRSTARSKSARQRQLNQRNRVITLLSVALVALLFAIGAVFAQGLQAELTRGQAMVAETRLAVAETGLARAMADREVAQTDQALALAEWATAAAGQSTAVAAWATARANARLSWGDRAELHAFQTAAAAEADAVERDIAAEESDIAPDAPFEAEFVFPTDSPTATVEVPTPEVEQLPTTVVPPTPVAPTATLVPASPTAVLDPASPTTEAIEVAQPTPTAAPAPPAPQVVPSSSAESQPSLTRRRVGE